MAESSQYMRMLPAMSRWILQGRADALSAAGHAWAAGLSSEICRARSQDDVHALWLGPEEHLLLAPPDHEPAVLRDALVGVAHSLVDVSHRQLAFEVRGPDCEVLLNAACPLDLHPERFPAGMCTRTVFGKADIVLWRTHLEAFHVEVWRSFLPYCTELLAEQVRD